MIAQIRPSALPEWIHAQASASPPVVLDVREPWELQTASVKPEGFQLIAIPMNQVAQRLDQLDAKRPIACLCHHGTRSQRVAAFLEYSGFEHVANIAGGIDAWSNERDPDVPRY